jgi:1-aminocyclopropane-1-carboxylate deaminase
LTFVPPPTQKIDSDIASFAGVELYVLRLDLMHPWVNGNKWYKLKYNLAQAKEQGYKKLLTFGGAYSNHIFATATAGKLLEFQTIGVIRGEETLPLNSTLSFATQQGMKLVYIDRATYRQKHSVEIEADLRKQFGEVFIIPEGGSNLQGVRGCLEIVSAAMQVFDTVCVACGTATTLAGIALSLNPKQRVLGFPVLKGGFLAKDIDNLVQNYLATGLPTPHGSPAPWELICDYHFGGYAKVKDNLLLFSRQFTEAYGIPLDYVYTAKMFYGVMDLLKQGYFSKGDRLLLIHTGGLQGNFGMNERLQRLLDC